MKGNLIKTYFLSIEQEMYDMNNPHEECVDYPTAGDVKKMMFHLLKPCSEYNDYMDCDDKFLHQYVKDLDLCNPFWIYSKPNETCSPGPYYSDLVEEEIIANLLSGITKSSCLQPCNTTKVYSK